MDTTDFYERYWQKEAGRGFAVPERQAKLHKALQGLPSGSPVLDAGCGKGEFSFYLAQLGYQVTGIDISEVAVEKARQSTPQGHFETASLDTKLPFPAEQFAAVWCTEVLEHLFDVHIALAELNRVLKPNGLLVLTTPYHGLVKNLAIAIAGFDRHYDPYISHIRFFTRRSLQMCLQRAGFQAEAWSGLGRRWPLWMSFFVVARKATLPGPAPEIFG
jgi:2-polyprenyl-3-methyl-5-hydroxy-6-metoxy-1,4-benzoquinol methylase